MSKPRIHSAKPYPQLAKCPTGREAIEAVVRHGRPVDLLITDVVMPNMSGRELAAESLASKIREILDGPAEKAKA